MVACIVIAIWDGECDRSVLLAELAQGKPTERPAVESTGAVAELPQTV